LADNILLNLGSGGETLATDDIGGIQFQIVKLTFGALESQTLASSGNGTVDAGTQRVTIASDTTGVLSVDDNGASLTVDNTTLDTAGGGTEAAAQRVTIANDSTGLLSIDDNGGSLTIDNAAIDTIGGGTEAAAQRVTLANDSTGLLTIDWAGTAPPIGAGVEATALRVTIATDSTGLLSVDDNGGSLTVDNSTLAVVGGGTEAAAMRVTIANDSTGLVSVDDNGGSLTVDNAGLTELAAAINANELDINIASSNATVTVDLGANNDVVGTTADNAAAATNPILIGAVAVETDGTDPTSVTAEADVARLRADRNRRLLVNTAHPNLFSASSDFAAAQTNTTVQAAPGANLSNYITDIMLSNGAVAGNITLLDGSGGGVLFELYPAINGGVSTRLATPIRQTANTLLAITSTTVTTHTVTVSGYVAP